MTGLCVHVCEGTYTGRGLGGWSGGYDGGKIVGAEGRRLMRYTE